MTGLKKAVTRVTEEPYDHHGRKLVIQLGPGDHLTLREQRCKDSVHIPIKDLYSMLLARKAGRILPRK